MSAYTAQFMPVAQNGVLTGSGGKVDAMDPTIHDNNNAGQRAYYQNYGRYTGGSSGSGGGYEDYLRQVYNSALQAQLKELESGYTANLSELDLSQQEIDGAYMEQKRQTSGQSEQRRRTRHENLEAQKGLNIMSIFDKLQRVSIQNEYGDITYADIKKMHLNFSTSFIEMGGLFVKV